MPDEDLIRGGGQVTPPSMRELAMILFRQRRVFVWVFGLVIAAAVLYALAGTKYESTMKVLVRRGRADAPVSADANAPLDLTRTAITEEELNSEVELLRDEEVLRKVVEANALGGRDWFHFLRLTEGPDQRMERAARRLAKQLQVEPLKKTNLIAISYSASSPQLAARVLQSVADAYLEKHVQVHRPNGEFRFFDQQRAESRLQLEEAKGRLLEFTANRGVIAAGQQRDLALNKLSELEASYRQTRIELAETQQRVSELQGLASKLPERTTTQVRIADNPELLKALKASLLDLQLKRTQLMTKFEPTHRLVQEVDQQIAQAESTIAAENALPLRDETTDKNQQYEWAKTELQKASVELMALRARASASLSQQATYRTAARQLAEDAVTEDELLSTEKAAQDSYLLYVKKREEARIYDALDERGIVNVVIAERPVASALPVWSSLTILAIGIFAAWAAGTGAALAADYTDTAFRTPEDVLAYLNTPVLASLPREIRGELSA